MCDWLLFLAYLKLCKKREDFKCLKKAIFYFIKLLFRKGNNLKYLTRFYGRV